MFKNKLSIFFFEKTFSSTGWTSGWSWSSPPHISSHSSLLFNPCKSHGLFRPSSWCCSLGQLLTTPPLEFLRSPALAPPCVARHTLLLWCRRRVLVRASGIWSRVSLILFGSRRGKVYSWEVVKSKRNWGVPLCIASGRGYTRSRLGICFGCQAAIPSTSKWWNSGIQIPNGKFQAGCIVFSHVVLAHSQLVLPVVHLIRVHPGSRCKRGGEGSDCFSTNATMVHLVKCEGYVRLFFLLRPSLYL
jgi:hypothetical protein